MMISVVIVTFNSDEYIQNCLNSIEQYNDLSYNDVEVIVVDNSPVTSLFLRKCVSEFKMARLIENTVNNGFGGGNNLGVSVATGDLLLFLNPDTVFVESLFRDVVNKFKDPEIGALGCQLVDEYGNRTNSYGYYPETRNITTSFLNKIFRLNDRIYKPKDIFPWGANLFVRKADFERVGKFDSTFFLCHEEADLCTRLKPMKVCILDKKIIHYEGHSTVHQGQRFDSWLKTLIQYHQKFGYSLNKTLIRYQGIFLFSIVFRFLSGKAWYPLVKNFKIIHNLRRNL